MYEVRVFEFFDNLNVVEFDVEVLIYVFEGFFELNIVFEFYGDFVVDESFKEVEYCY